MTQPFMYEKDVLLAGVVGSRAYGLATPSSDTDRLGVYQAPTEHFLGLNAPVGADLSRVDHEPDVTYHEILKFCRLSLVCNPSVIELLWLTEYEVVTKVGQQLVDMRDAFLSAGQVRRAYLGYAEGQVERLFREPEPGTSKPAARTAKLARHLLRLLHQGYGLYRTGALQVKLDDPQSYHDFGDLVVREPAAARERLAYYEWRFDRLTSPLPEVADAMRVEDWLVQQRLSSL